MGSIKKTLGELLLLGALSVGLAFTVNAVRTSRSIKVNKPYFTPKAEVGNGDPSRPKTSPAPKATVTVTPPEGEPVKAASAAVSPQPSVAESKKLEHDYQEISFEEVVEVFNDPATKQGLNVFVDARKHEVYDEGHIPGALHCDPYEAEKHIDQVLAQANGVERVIVYCGGGDCEDSIFMCRELVEAGVSQDSIYLYPGGFTEWLARNMPTEVGHEE